MYAGEGFEGEVGALEKALERNVPQRSLGT